MTKQKTNYKNLTVDTMKGYVYKITNLTNGKPYVGITDNADRRWHEWQQNDTTDLGRDIQELGKANFKFEVLLYGKASLIATAEPDTIRSEGALTPDGYNKHARKDKIFGTQKDLDRRVLIQTQNLGRKMTDEVIKQREATKKARKPKVKDENINERIEPNQTE